MKLNKIFIIVLLPIVLLNAQGPKSLYQFLANWPAGCDTTGKHWVVYNLYKPETHFVTETSVSSVTMTTLWMAQIGNFNGGESPWVPGDTLVALGSIDSAYIHNPGTYGDNIDHTGFYWLFSDTITSATPEAWSPSDTVWVIPKVDVTKTGPGGGANDTIWFEFPNPKETRRVDQTDYDVYGYWLFADTTGTGTPNAFNAGTVMDLGVIPVNGVYGDTTVHWMLESDGFEGWVSWTVYFAYKIITRPDTTADNVGYTTYYLSQNSDPTTVYQNVVGVRERDQLKNQHIDFQVFPNLFTENTDILFSITEPTSVKLVVYNTSGQIVRTLVDEVKPAGEHHVEFDRIDNQGMALPAGIYFCSLETTEFAKVKKIILAK